MIRCNRCIGCKLDYENEWATRMVHEGRTSVAAYFLTLTYDDDHLPPGNSLRHKDWQKFIKALRNRFPRLRIRYFQCGEYGEKTGRPHFHAALYGLELDDRRPSSKGRGDHAKDYFESETIDKAWAKGAAICAPLNFKTASYMARYMLKTATTEGAKNQFQWLGDHGEHWDRMPPYATMSTKPGIGFKWFEKYGISDVYDSGDFVFLEGKRLPPPRYYDRLLEKKDPALYAEIKARREDEGRQLKALQERSKQRMDTKQECKRLKLERPKFYA